MIRFSLLHPSRGRPALAERAIAEWTGEATAPGELEYLLSVDHDDAQRNAYAAVAARRGVGLIVGAHRSLVDAANHAAAQARGDVLVVVSDDFGCPPGWDAALAAVLGERRDAAVLVHDGVDGRILTLPVIGRDLYDRLGYVYHPSYSSLYCDDDLTATVRGLGALIDARHLRFPHRHWTTGATPYDATYARSDGAAAWWSGWRIFEKRRLVDFGRRPRTLTVRAGELGIDLRYWLRRGGSVAKRRWRAVRSALRGDETR